MIFTKLLTVVIPREGSGMRRGSEKRGPEKGVLSLFILLVPRLFEFLPQYIPIFLKQKTQKKRVNYILKVQ